MPIQTRVVRPEARNIIKTGLVSQSKTVRNYAIQLKSRVISDDHRKAVLKNMQRELTAQRYCRPEKRSIQTAVNYSEGIIHQNSLDTIQTAVNSGRITPESNAPEEKSENDNGYYHPYLYGKRVSDGGSYESNYTREGGGRNEEAHNYYSDNHGYGSYYSGVYYPQKNSGGIIQTAVTASGVQTQKNSGFIRTAKYEDLPEDVKAVMTESKRLKEQESRKHSDFYRNALISGMVIRGIRLKNKRYRVSSIQTAAPDPSGGVPEKKKPTYAKRIIRAVGIKEQQLHNQKYIVAAADTDNSVALESAELVRHTADTVIQTGGTIRTAVRKTADGISGIRSVARNGIKLGKAKDVGRIATAVGGGVKNIVADTGRQLLKTKIDKTKTTDTGKEAIKQGITDIRYIDNGRRAVLNTARTAVKTGYAVKNMPRDTRAQMRRIRKNAEKARAAAQKTAEVIKKIFTSKAGLIVIGAVVLILVLVTLLNGFISVIVSSVTSLFSFLVSEDGSEDVTDILNGYETAVVEYIDEKQAEINAVVDGFVCDRREYPPYDEITELNQFGNKDISIEDTNSVTAILAVLRYREMQEEGGTEETAEIEFKFTDEEIKEVVDKFYTFEYYYTYGNCNYPYCKCRTDTTSYYEGTPYEFSVETTEYYCDVDHKWLHGEVTNHTADEVMDEYGFTDEEKAMYEMYLAQLGAMTEGSDDSA